MFDPHPMPRYSPLDWLLIVLVWQLWCGNV
jgi:hypothetical protein